MHYFAHDVLSYVFYRLDTRERNLDEYWLGYLSGGGFASAV